MIQLTGKLQLVQSRGWALQLAKDALLSIINDKVKQNTPQLTLNVKKELLERLTNSEVYMQLEGRGRLLGMIGEPQIEEKLYAIVNTLCDSVEVKVKPFVARGNYIAGGVKVSAVHSTYEDIMPLGEIRSKSGSHNWIEWLLTASTFPLVYDFECRFPPNIPASVVQQHSRTGLALMMPKRGATFSIPAQYAGSLHSNWITKALAGMDDFFDREFQRLLS